MPGAINAASVSATEPAAALTPDEFARALVNCGVFPTSLALAVSGGPDSMAMALCAQKWATAQNTPLLAFIVDHGLRPESEAEANQTKRWLANMGVAAEILRWNHPPLISKLHITARKARYQLLTDACRRHNITHLMTAHHRDDQAETVLMRMAKGSGIDGLAGINVITRKHGVTLLRPFLSIPKERLIATCVASNLPYVTDASNSSAKFARGRLRRVLPLLAKEGLTIERLIDLGIHARDARDALDFYTQRFLAEAVTADAAGSLRIDRAALGAVPGAIAARALKACFQYVYPQDYAPEHAALTRLTAKLFSHRDMHAATLHGCMISVTIAHIHIVREASLITDHVLLRPGDSLIWDRRWQVTLNKNIDSDITVKALGNPPHAVLDQWAPHLRRIIPQGRIRAGLPACYKNDKLFFVPFLTQETPAQSRFLSTWPPNPLNS